MALLQNHLEQIGLSAKSIGELEFAPSGPFTNALLNNQEITALIRDVEPHERGLFTIDPDFRSGLSHGPSRNDTAARRKTVQSSAQLQSSAVARVLGSEMLGKIQSANRDGVRAKHVDIEVLLHGAEKLCAAFDVPGAMDRVATLRTKHDQISASIKGFEDRVRRQQSSISRLDTGSVEDNGIEDNGADPASSTTSLPQTITDDDLRAEEEAVKELESRKKALESRVAGMERDLGGLRG